MGNSINDPGGRRGLRVGVYQMIAEIRPRHWQPSGRHGYWHPPTDVFETDDCAVVTVEIAGLGKEDFSISLANRTLTIQGERRDPALDKLGYQQMEIQYGPFYTQVYLPWAIEEDSVEATYENGFLRITLRKAQARRVPVRVVTDEAES